MNLQDFRCRLIASVQSSTSPSMESPAVLAAIALAHKDQGVQLLRAQGIENIRAIREATGLPTIGLIKKEYPGSEVYITPTLAEVRTLIELGCEVIALDATGRNRPGKQPLVDLIQEIHTAGRIAMADCDSIQSASFAVDSGADWIGTTLNGYTAATKDQASSGPNVRLVWALAKVFPNQPIIAEGRYYEPWQVRAALRAGATAVVVGGALNDPAKQTARFAPFAKIEPRPVGAVDIGGTWLRFAVVDSNLSIQASEKIALPHNPADRLAWILNQCERYGIDKLGISTGGVVDPKSNTVIEAKDIIPGHVGTIFRHPMIKVRALNDGLATAWGHAMHPDFAACQTVATLALGTGVGCGVVRDGQILMPVHGDYPRLNDLPAAPGKSFEDLLGGAALSPNPTESQQRDAQTAFEAAVRVVQGLYHPDLIVVCGGVGLAPWLQLPEKDCVRTPYGEHAGILGAACYALFS